MTHNFIGSIFCTKKEKMFIFWWAFDFLHLFKDSLKRLIGRFQLLDLSLVEILSVKKNPLQNLLSMLNAVISTNERHWIITGHVTFKLRYNQI